MVIAGVKKYQKSVRAFLSLSCVNFTVVPLAKTSYMAPARAIVGEHFQKVWIQEGVKNRAIINTSVYQGEIIHLTALEKWPKIN